MDILITGGIGAPARNTVSSSTTLSLDKNVRVAVIYTNTDSADIFRAGRRYSPRYIRNRGRDGRSHCPVSPCGMHAILAIYPVRRRILLKGQPHARKAFLL